MMQCPPDAGLMGHHHDSRTPAVTTATTQSEYSNPLPGLAATGEDLERYVTRHSVLRHFVHGLEGVMSGLGEETTSEKRKRQLELDTEADQEAGAESEPKRIKKEKQKMACNQTAVAVLQELCMKRRWNPPLYEVTDVGGPSNDPMFEVSVTLCNGIKGVGRGRQKKAAKHDAAKKALDQLQEKALTDGSVKPVISKGPINPHEDAGGMNAVGELQTLCLSKHFPTPEYTVIGDEGEPHEKLFTYKCTVSQRSATGTARKKQLAKHLAAQNMLKILESNLKSILDEIPNDPAVSSMYSQKSKDMPAPTAASERTSSKMDLEVVARYKTIKDNTEDIPSAPMISPGTKFADYHLKFAAQLEGYSDILQKPVVKQEKNYLKKLMLVAEDLHLKVSMTSDRGKDQKYIIFVQVDTDPPAIQAGHDESESSAVQQAAFNVLEFFSIMSN